MLGEAGLAVHLDPPEEAEREEPGDDADDPIERQTHHSADIATHARRTAVAVATTRWISRGGIDRTDQSSIR